MLEKYPDLISRQELKEILRIGESTSYKIIHRELEAFMQGNKWLIPKESVIKYINEKIADQQDH